MNHLITVYGSKELSADEEIPCEFAVDKWSEMIKQISTYERELKTDQIQALKIIRTQDKVAPGGERRDVAIDLYLFYPCKTVRLKFFLTGYG